MTQLFEYIKMALKNIAANKGRTILTMLGIVSSRVVSYGRYGRTTEIYFEGSTVELCKVLMNEQRLADCTTLAPLMKYK